MLLSVLICFYGKKISVSEFLRSARSSFLLFPIKKENRQRLYNLLSIFILKLILATAETATSKSIPQKLPAKNLTDDNFLPISGNEKGHSSECPHKKHELFS